MPVYRHNRAALGEQGLHIVREAAYRAGELSVEIERARKRGERERRQAVVEQRSVRPAVGTSEMLSRPLTMGVSAGVDGRGKIREVETHDLVGMAPCHLKGDRP